MNDWRLVNPDGPELNVVSPPAAIISRFPTVTGFGRLTVNGDPGEANWALFC